MLVPRAGYLAVKHIKSKRRRGQRRSCEEVKRQLAVHVEHGEQHRAHTTRRIAEREKIREVKAEIISENSFIGYDEAIYFIGDCSAKCKGVLTKPNFIFRDDLIYPSANEMGFLSNEQYEKSNFVNVAYFEPCYLKDFVMTVSKK